MGKNREKAIFYSGVYVALKQQSDWAEASDEDEHRMRSTAIAATLAFFSDVLGFPKRESFFATIESMLDEIEEEANSLMKEFMKEFMKENADG